MFNPDASPFPSHSFTIDPAVQDAPNFTRLARDHAGAATEFEQIVRAGHDRVSGERVKARREMTADWKPVMNLLRPLYCEEQVQYATEDFGTGLINVTTLIPGGLRESYRALSSEAWPWDWVNNPDGRIRLPSPASVPPLFMFPIRGNVDVDYESRMLAVHALTPMQVLRVRALDWKQPVQSELRCGLWTKAWSRFSAVAPAVAAGRVIDQVPAMYEQIMQLAGVSLLTGDDTTLIALDRAGDRSNSELAAAIAAGKQTATCVDGAACTIDVHAFGDLLAAHVASFTDQDASGDAVRLRLLAVRDALLCKVHQRFANAPALPTIECP
jgi:hypothetical protein